MKHLPIFLACLGVFIVCKPKDKGALLPQSQEMVTKGSEDILQQKPLGQMTRQELQAYHQDLKLYLEQLQVAKDEALKRPNEHGVEIFRLSSKAQEVERELEAVAQRLASLKK